MEAFQTTSQTRANTSLDDALNAMARRDREDLRRVSRELMANGAVLTESMLRDALRREVRP